VSKQVCLHEENSLILAFEIAGDDSVEAGQDDFAHWNQKAKGSVWESMHATVRNPSPFAQVSSWCT